MSRLNSSRPAFEASRHERAIQWLFLGFALSVLGLWAAALVLDAARPDRRRLEIATDRAALALIFSLGLLHVLISGGIWLAARSRIGRLADGSSAAKFAFGCSTILLALCESPALFGWVYVWLGGETLPAEFFFSFSLTAMAAHYAARLRPGECRGATTAP